MADGRLSDGSRSSHASPRTPEGPSEKTIRRKIVRGELTAYRFGSRVVKLKVADLDSVYTT